MAVDVTKPGRSGQRDAIHVAVIWVLAGEGLYPGTRVKIQEQKEAFRNTKEWHGVVDPYLKDPVRVGDGFWLYLKPNSVTDMTHQWDHPDFPIWEENRFEGVLSFYDVAHLGDLAGKCGWTVEILLSEARKYVEQGREEQACANDENYMEIDNSDWRYFWEIFFKLYPKLKFEVDKEDPALVYRCAC